MRTPRKECFVNIPPDGTFGRTEAPYRFAAVDGGTIDNEPLELARRYLAGQQQHNERDGEKANKAVVLVGAVSELQDGSGIRRQRQAHPSRASLSVGAY